MSEPLLTLPLKRQTYWLLKKELEHARTKHPIFTENAFQGLSIVTEEVGELAQALNDDNLEKAKIECAQVVVSATRMLEFLMKEEA